MFHPFSIFEDKEAVSVDSVKEAIDKKLDTVIVDVREPDEYAQGHIVGSILVPLSELPSAVAKMSQKTKRYYVYCRSGSRSGQAVNMLKQRGYTDVHNMKGGILAWRTKGYPLSK